MYLNSDDMVLVLNNISMQRYLLSTHPPYSFFFQNPNFDQSLHNKVLDHLMTFSDHVRSKILPKMLTLADSSIVLISGDDFEDPQANGKVESSTKVKCVKFLSWLMPYLPPHVFLKHQLVLAKFVCSWKSIISIAEKLVTSHDSFPALLMQRQELVIFLFTFLTDLKIGGQARQ